MVSRSASAWWLSLSYFAALAAGGSVGLMLLVGPWWAVLPELATVERLRGDAEQLRVLVFVVALLGWTTALVVLWYRHGRLVPAAARRDARRRLRAGHLLIGGGHALIATVMVLDPAGWLLFRPALIAAVRYAAGALLIETSRARVPDRR